ncbi:MAG: hypothetical protein KJ579_03530 [Verrucomicrobia bacterium]|jgi:hypothetical protein|nr:hypothetical protein [Verrucomicrobiota bacterium]MCX7318739.1 hypothetical protein [Hyphomicrobiales bacterium]
MEHFKRMLAEAREAKKPWFEIARLMSDEIGTPAEDGKAAHVISAAREATGLSPQILKRHLVLLARVRTIAAEMGVPEKEILSPLFNAQEIAVRLHKTIPKAEAADVLLRLARGELNLPRVRELQAQLAAPFARFDPNRVIARQRRSVNAGIVEIALMRSAPKLWGTGSTVTRRPQLLFVGGRPGYEVIGADGSVLAGIDVLFPDSEMNRDYLETNLGVSLLLAPFFSKFYLAMSPDADEDAAKRLLEVLDWFGYGWVGILAVEGEDGVSVSRAPEGEPSPDRTSKYESLKRKYRRTNSSGAPLAP